MNRPPLQTFVRNDGAVFVNLQDVIDKMREVESLYRKDGHEAIADALDHIASIQEATLLQCRKNSEAGKGTAGYSDQPPPSMN